MHGVPRLPALSPVARPESKSVAPIFRPQERPVVLIVDDDDGVREALHLILDESYSVLDVADGRTALSLIREQPVDLVLLDILMPDVDGIEILQELRSFEPHLPVIMMTAVRTVLTAVASMKLGAADYITKPFAEANLLAAIHSALEQRRGRRVPADLKPLDPVARPARSYRVLLVEGDLGWRATIAVALERIARVETAPTLGEALNQVLRLRPTCVVLNVRRSSAEAARFLGAVHAQLPACPALVISEDPHLQATLAWESLNIRGVLQPPIDPGGLVRRIAAIAAPTGDGSRAWPQLSRFISHAIDYLGVHFGDDLSVDGVAESVGISGSHLAHLFRAETGTTVRDYLNRVRVEIARDLLSHTDENLAEIAAFVGFFDASHLSRVFHQIRGKRPSAYRRSASTKRPD